MMVGMLDWMTIYLTLITNFVFEFLIFSACFMFCFIPFNEKYSGLSVLAAELKLRKLSYPDRLQGWITLASHPKLLPLSTPHLPIENP